jgi:hypothetical protein
MRKYKFLIGAFALLVMGTVFYSCQEDDQSIGEVKAPQNLTVEAVVMNVTPENEFGDGSGDVQITASAEDAITYEIFYGDNISEIVPAGDTIHTYSLTGVNTYDITVVAKGTGGASTSATTSVTVFSSFDDPVVKDFLTGGDSKTWYVASALPGHLGVGPTSSAGPDYYSAAPGEKAQVNGEPGCFYDDAITFSLDGNQIRFNHENNGDTFFNATYNSVGGGNGPDDSCLLFNTSGEKVVSLTSANSNVPEEESTGTNFIISDGGFMSYYLNSSTYEVLEINESYMELRVLMGPGGDPELAWYLKFTTDEGGGTGGSAGGSPLQSIFDTEIWSDEFEGNGQLDSQFWNYEIGNNNGWGNQELQYYTQENGTVENGLFSIDLIKEPTSGFDYSSSRVTTEDKFEFTYGRVDISAKLPEGGGVWPALWMLGAADIQWPDRGEIDIMEHNGNNPTVVSSALHYPQNFGGNAVSDETVVNGNPSQEFHKYTVEWREDRILFAVDDIVYHEFQNGPNTPYHDPFFLIMNVAMGGTFVNFEVDPNFQQSEMEVEYIKVYQ